MSQTIRRPGSRPARLLMAGLLLAVAGSFVLTAQAAPPDGMRHGPMGGHMAGPMGGMGGGGGMMFGGRFGERVLDDIGATAEQRTQIRQILEAARNDLRSQRDAGRALHDQARQLFTQPTVDANAAEALRQQMMARHDQASRRMLQAMIDVSRVLTPEQRAKIGERMNQRRAMMERHRSERESLERRPR